MANTYYTGGTSGGGGGSYGFLDAIEEATDSSGSSGGSTDKEPETTFDDPETKLNDTETATEPTTEPTSEPTSDTTTDTMVTAPTGVLRAATDEQGGVEQYKQQETAAAGTTVDFLKSSTNGETIISADYDGGGASGVIGTDSGGVVADVSADGEVTYGAGSQRAQSDGSATTLSTTAGLPTGQAEGDMRGMVNRHVPDDFRDDLALIAAALIITVLLASGE